MFYNKLKNRQSAVNLAHKIYVREQKTIADCRLRTAD